MRNRIIDMVVPTREYIKSNHKLVSMKPTQYNNVYVLKYSRKVFFKYLWNEMLCECRGTLVDSDMNVVSRPFTKIFNSDEDFAPEFDDEEMVYVDDKINGFMACATWHNGELIVSTTGTTWSEFADTAREYIEKNIHIDMFRNNPEFSFIFEICTPEDTHIIDEEFGVYLLGARVKSWSKVKSDLSYRTLNVMAVEYAKPDCVIYRPLQYTMLYRQVVEMLKTYKREGFVVTSCNNSSKQVKMKSPYYLTTKFLTRINNTNIERLLSNPQAVKTKIDEEFFGIADHISGNLEVFKTFTNNEKCKYIKDFFDD